MGFSRTLKNLFTQQPAQSETDDSTRLRLELALEASGLVDWDFDYEKNTAHRSLRHDQLYGYTKMLPQWNFENFYHHVLPEYHEMVSKKFADIAKNGGIECEFKIRKVDGEIRWIHLVGKGSRNAQGKVTNVAGILKDITLEKLRSDRLNLQSQNLASLFEKSPEFFCVLVGEKYTYAYVNPAHIELFNGVDMTGRTVIDDQKEIHESEFIKVLNKVMETGETFFFKESPAQIGTRLRYLDMIYAPRRNLDGNVDGVYALGSDVTDRVKAIAQAKDSEAKMKLITDKLPAFISYTDSHGRYQFMNAMYEKWFQRPISEMLGKTRNEIAPPEYAVQSKPYQTKALHGEGSHHEGIIRKANGEYLNLDINFVPDVDQETGDVRGMIAVGVDVTQQMNYLQEAELARKELEEVFMQAPAPMCLLTGPKHVFTMANPLYEEFVNRKVVGRTLDDVFAEEDIETYRKIINHVYTTGDAYEIFQEPIKLYDENGKLTTRYLNVGYHAYKERDGKVKGVLVILQDVTEQVNSVLVRDNFMGIASHELKTPITALKLQTQMYQKILELEGAPAFDFVRLEKIFQTTNNQVNRLARLVDDMLDITRITVDKLDMHFKKTNLSRVVQDAFENFLPQFKSVGIELKLIVEPNVSLMIDEERIEQVVTNLITNAIKYAPNAPLVVELKETSKSALLTVKDSGKGIEEKYFEKIFDRFERIDQGRDISGMGIGLFISKQIAEAHQGTITVASQVGQGTTFTLELPIK